LTGELFTSQHEIKNVEDIVENKESAISKLNSEIMVFKSSQRELELELGSKEEEQNKLTSEIGYLKKRV
jgi:predicted  nucleic acid-binding Zn-ribbon protein